MSTKRVPLDVIDIQRLTWKRRRTIKEPPMLDLAAQETSARTELNCTIGQRLSITNQQV